MTAKRTSKWYNTRMRRWANKDEIVDKHTSNDVASHVETVEHLRMVVLVAAAETKEPMGHG